MIYRRHLFLHCLMCHMSLDYRRRKKGMIDLRHLNRRLLFDLFESSFYVVRLYLIVWVLLSRRSCQH